MKNTYATLAAIVLAISVAACNSDRPAPAADTADANSNVAEQTEATYGEETAVKIEAEPADENHAHDADGSHPEAKEEDHPHGSGDGEHAAH